MTTNPPSIHALMSRVMRDIQAIQKDQRNPHFNYAFRGIDQVYNALWGPLTEHGVFYVPKIIEKSLEHGGKAWHCAITIRYRFYGPNGDYVEAEGMGEAIDTQDKASTKAQQMALKYALLSTFCIPTEEQRRDDPDGHAPVSGANQAGSEQSEPKATSGEGSGPGAVASPPTNSGSGQRGDVPRVGEVRDADPTTSAQQSLGGGAEPPSPSIQSVPPSEHLDGITPGDIALVASKAGGKRDDKIAAIQQKFQVPRDIAIQWLKTSERLAKK